MDTAADQNAAPSFSARFLQYLESREPERDLTILSRALLASRLGQANDQINEAHALPALSSRDLARCATQYSADTEPEWEHVGTLEVELCRNWLLYGTHLSEVHLDLFRERGPTRPPQNFGRVYVPEVEEIMWHPWIRAISAPLSTDTGLLQALPDGLSRPYYPCKAPPCRQRFMDVTLRTALWAMVENAFPAYATIGGFVSFCFLPVILLRAYLNLSPFPSDYTLVGSVGLNVIGFGVIMRNIEWLKKLLRIRRAV